MITPTHNRIFGLNILRAAAILFVMQIHSLVYIEPHADVHYYWLFLLDGVDLFFVLSGFLIGGILIRTIHEEGFGRQQLLNFWIRRWFRTLPNYFLILLLLIAAYRYAFHIWPPKAGEFFLFIQCFASPHPHFFPEAWSLAVEEWFYLLIPLGLFLALIFRKNKQKTILYWIVIVLTSVTLFRLYKVYTHHYVESGSWDRDIRKQVLTRLDTIMYGFLGAYFYAYKKAAWEKRKTLLFITGLLLLFGSRIAGVYSDIWYGYFNLSVQSIGVLCLLPKLTAIQTGKGVVYKLVTFISVISYSMYLVNYTLVAKIIVPGILKSAGMTEKNIFNSMAALILFWLLTILLSWVLYRFYEWPMMNLRNRFQREKKTASEKGF